jgi:hypothetical protein
MLESMSPYVIIIFFFAIMLLITLEIIENGRRSKEWWETLSDADRIYWMSKARGNPNIYGAWIKF